MAVRLKAPDINIETVLKRKKSYQVGIWYSGHVEKVKFYLISNLPYFSFEWEN